MRERDIPSDVALGPEVEAVLKELALAEPSTHFTRHVLGRLERPEPRGFQLGWRPVLAGAFALIVVATGWWLMAERRVFSPASGLPTATNSPAIMLGSPSGGALAVPGAGERTGATEPVASRARGRVGPRRVVDQSPVATSAEWAAGAARGTEDALVIAPIDPPGDIVLDAVAFPEI